MHETSIVNSIIATLEQEFEAEKLQKMKAAASKEKKEATPTLQPEAPQPPKS